ncbi:glycosyl transferase, family 39 [Actinokineospora spheciospongiae]|uniref:Glycosyl transferase, family 39 n=1 Tax=Actinokineospora spheciospongiae TaxID=909613 RepID=W7IUI9_9PSEU|nr:glycosyltransferase family 39 protein [Actinokineospora spheciospongiae]EWC64033.1 glycosyl transferase, family 39 [Actinokineospora spheciospongiae]
MTTLLSRPAESGHRADDTTAPTPRLRRFARGPETDPRFARPALLGLLAATALLYLWNLTASGYGNEFYAAAVQAGTQSWKAWLFGSLDSGNAITVDKPPGALWVATAFARVFGFSGFSVLVPQALMGVASVGLLHAAVKRTSGPAAGLIAGAVLALTPVAVLMFRFNNPDALLVLLLVAAAYCVVRALEEAGPKWLVLVGTAIGFAFLTKMLQAFLVLPAFALVYLVAAPTGLGRRVAHLARALAAVVVSAGWYVALVELWPADSRPYIGGSTDNSLLELALGYNGLGRVLGGEGNGGGGGGANTGFGGETGLLRMFNTAFGSEISWLLPAALIALVGGLWLTRRAPRTDRTRAALLLWGGWLVVTALVFSHMGGTTHPYYAVALAPAIAALVGVAGRELWRGRASFAPRAWLAGMIAATATWDHVLLAREADYLPWLKFVIAAVGLALTTALLVGVENTRRTATILLTAAVLVLGLGGAAYAVTTSAQAHSGSIPTSGPTSGAMGGPGGTSTGSTGVADLLATSTAKWAAAVSGSQTAAGLELQSGKAVIAIGGWSGTDDAPTFEQFTAAVAAGEIDYYVVGGQGGGRGGSDSSAGEIATWVAANHTATTVGDSTVYDLTP